MTIIQIAFFLLIIIISSEFECDLNQYAQYYSNQFQFFESLASMKWQFNPTLITVTNFRALRITHKLSLQSNSILFENNHYFYVFDLSISFENNNPSVKRSEVMIDLTIPKMTFACQLDGTVALSIDQGERKCYFHLDDLLKYRIFHQVYNKKEVMCAILTDTIIHQMKKTILSFPPNNHKVNLDNLITFIREKQHLNVLDTDYMLNDTHTVLDMSLGNISYSNQIHYQHWSEFTSFHVDISYSIVNSKYIVSRKKESFKYKVLYFGRNKMDFSDEVVGDRNLAHLISIILPDLEKKRNWVESVII